MLIEQPGISPLIPKLLENVEFFWMIKMKHWRLPGEHIQGID